MKKRNKEETGRRQGGLRLKTKWGTKNRRSDDFKRTHHILRNKTSQSGTKCRFKIIVNSNHVGHIISRWLEINQSHVLRRVPSLSRNYLRKSTKYRLVVTCSARRSPSSSSTTRLMVFSNQTASSGLRNLWWLSVDRR